MYFNRFRYLLPSLLCLMVLYSCNNRSKIERDAALSKYIIPAFKKANTLSASNADSTILLCDYMLRLTQDINDVDSFENAIRHLKIEAIINKGSTDKAIELLQNYLAVYKDPMSQGIFNLQQSDLLVDLGKNEESLIYAEKALASFKKVNSKSYIAACYTILGVGLTNLGRLIEAEKALYQSMVIYEEINELGYYGSVLQNIGNLYIDLQDLAKAKEYYLKAMAIKLKLNDYVGIASIYNNMGIIYRKDQPDSALYYYKSIPAPNGDNDILKHFVKAQFNIANIYKDKGKLDSALAKFQEVERLCIENDIPQGIPRVLYSYGDINFIEGKPAKAIEYLNSAADWCDSLNIITLKKDVLKLKIEILSKTKQFEEALLAQNFYNAIEDSIKVNESKEAMQRMEQANKDKLDLLAKLDEQKKNNEQTKHWKWFGMFLTSILLAFIFIYFLNKRRA